MQFTEVTEVERPLVRTNVLDLLAVSIRQRYITHREIREAGTDTATQITEVIESGEVSQVDVTYQLTQPRRVVRGDTTLRVHVCVLGRVPELRVKVRLGSYAEITHTGSTCIRRNRERRHRCDQRVHRVIYSSLSAHRYGAYQGCERNKNFFHFDVFIVCC